MPRTFALLSLMLLISCGFGGRSETPSTAETRAKFGFSSDIVEICDAPGVLGVRIDPVGRGSSNASCGFNDAVRVYAVGGVALNPPARMQCRTARITSAWMSEAVLPTFRDARRDLDSMRVAADYSCRTRNSRRGARISEHAKGTAIDISAFRMADGETLTVLGDWRNNNGGFMKRVFRASCRIWHTSIGPDGDRFHQDHFHFDATRDRGPNTWCR
ncbi:MAG: extensin family protein [Rhodobacteraceae bacterium]|nr:extensin family protein [Paracoccaceae bacterium]